MAQFTLKCGATVIVDEIDLPLLHNYHWHLNHYGYVVRFEGSKPKQRCIFLHREIVGAKTGEQVDHEEGNLLDCRRSKLRIATVQQNRTNTKKYMGTSKFKGVSWFKRDSRWHAQIRINGKPTHLGYFDDEIEAARVYNAAALHHFGKFARLNKL